MNRLLASGGRCGNRTGFLEQRGLVIGGGIALRLLGLRDFVVKLHDKVAQTEQSQGDASTNDQPSLFEKARAIAAATSGGKKTVQVAAYASTTKPHASRAVTA